MASSVQQDAKDFLVDVHVVTRNFMGRQNWQFAKKAEVKFIDEMMTDTSGNISNDSKIEQRISLGVCAALYTIPYVIGKVIVEGILNTTQYVEKRVTKKPLNELHPKDRVTSDYVFGAPLSLGLITPIVAVESAFRAAGVSAYGGHVIRAAGKRATRISKRYTGWLITPSTDESIEEDQNVVFSLPKNWWDAMDRVGLITLPGVIAATEILGATLLTATCGTLEATGRVLGINTFGGSVVRLAGRRAKNMSRYTRALFGGVDNPERYAHETDELQKNVFESFTSRPENGWEVLNRISLITLPGLIATIEIGVGAVITAVGFVSENLFRLFGFSSFGAEMIRLAGRRVKAMSLYTRKLFGLDDNDVDAYNVETTRRQKTWFLKPDYRNEDAVWNSKTVMNRAAFLTFPGIISAVAIGFGAAVTAICFAGEYLGRVLGFTSFGAEMIRLAGRRVKAMSSYTRKMFGLDDQDVKEYVAETNERGKAWFFKPDYSDENGKWNSKAVVNRAALLTFPGIISAVMVGFGAAVTAVCGFGEYLGRVLGFTSFGAEIIRLAGRRTANMSSYTRKLFGVDDAKKYSEETNERQKDWFFKPDYSDKDAKWNSRTVFNRASLVTFPGVISAVVIGFGAAVTAVCGFGEYLGRVLGFTSFGAEMIRLAGRRVKNMSSYTRKMFGIEEKDSKDYAAETKRREKVWFFKPDYSDKDAKWSSRIVINRVCLVTFPAMIAAVTIGFGAAASAIGGMGEYISRIFGFSSFGAEMIRLAGRRVKNMSSYTRKMFGIDEKDAEEYAAETKRRENEWFFKPDYSDKDAKWNSKTVINRVGLITFPGLVAAVTIGFGAAVTAVCGFGEYLGRILGFTSFGAEMIRLTGRRVANMSLYTRKIFGVDDAKKYSEETNEGQKDWFFKPDYSDKDAKWGSRTVFNRASLVTLPGMISAVVIGFGTAVTAVCAFGEYLGRVLGFTSFGAEMIRLAGRRVKNMSVYTRKLFGVDEKDVEAYAAETKRREKEWFLKPDYSDENIKWNSRTVFNRGSLVTLPGILSAVVIGFGAAVTAVGGFGENLRRVLGFTSFGAEMIRLAGRRAANMSSYTRKIFGIDDAKKYSEDTTQRQKEWFFKPDYSDKEATWNSKTIFNRGGLITFPGIISAITVGFGAAITAVCFVGEYLGRALGFTSFGAEMIRLAARRMVNRSSYTRRLFRLHASEVDEYAANTVHRQNAWFFKPDYSDKDAKWNSKTVINRVGLVTLPGIISAIMIGIGAAITAIGFVSEVIGRMLGFTRYGANVIKAAWKRTANIGPTWFFKYTPESITDNHRVVVAPPRTPWGIVNRVCLVTLPAVIAIASFGFVMTLNVLDSVRRGLGFTFRARAASFLAFKACATMLGFTPNENLTNDFINYIKRPAKDVPVKSYWNLMDWVGVVFRAAETGIISTAIMAPLALIGISKANYHRLHYYRLNLSNTIKSREGKPQNLDDENYHKEKLAECDKTKLGKFFSHVNVFNIVTQALYFAARFVVAPLMYGLIRGIKQLFGIVPLIKFIHHAIHPRVYGSSPEEVIRKRFADFKKSLDKYGHLDLPEGATSLEISAKVNQAEKRGIIGRAAFSLFSGGRKIMSLGYTPEERIVAVFKDRFEEFMRAKKRLGNGDAVNVNQFFTNVVELKNGERFSYEEMVKRIQRSFADPKDKAEINRIASLLKNDIQSSDVKKRL